MKTHPQHRWFRFWAPVICTVAFFYGRGAAAQITLAPAVTNVIAGDTVQLTLANLPTDTNNPALRFSISSSLGSRVTVPATAAQDYDSPTSYASIVTFDATGVQPGGPALIRVTFTNGFSTVTLTSRVTVVAPVLTFDSAPITVNDGETVPVTISRNSSSAALQVTLISSDADVFGLGADPYFINYSGSLTINFDPYQTDYTFYLSGLYMPGASALLYARNGTFQTSVTVNVAAHTGPYTPFSLDVVAGNTVTLVAENLPITTNDPPTRVFFFPEDTAVRISVTTDVFQVLDPATDKNTYRSWVRVPVVGIKRIDGVLPDPIPINVSFTMDPIYGSYASDVTYINVQDPTIAFNPMAPSMRVGDTIPLAIKRQSLENNANLPFTVTIGDPSVIGVGTNSAVLNTNAALNTQFDLYQWSRTIYLSARAMVQDMAATNVTVTVAVGSYRTNVSVLVTREGGLVLTPVNPSVAAGDTLAMTVTRTTGTNVSPLNVTLTSDDPLTAIVPETATLPVGNPSYATFNVTGLVPGSSVIRVSALGVDPTSNSCRTVVVRNPTLAFAPDPASNVVGGARTITITRPSNEAGGKLDIALATPTPALVSLATDLVSIAAGQVGGTFTVYGLAAGQGTIVARVGTYSTNLAINVSDPQLGFSPNVATSVVGGVGVVTITRPANQAGTDLTINLALTPAGLCNLATNTVTMAAGAISVNVSLYGQATGSGALQARVGAYTTNATVVVVEQQVDDPDGDGLTDEWEAYLGGNPYNAYSLDPLGTNGVNDGQYDSDGDGLINMDEIDNYLTDPARRDTDDDGVNDQSEVARDLTNPRHPMSVSNFYERSLNLAAIPTNGFLLPKQDRFIFGTNGWTVECWVWPGTDGDGELFSFNRSGTNNGFWVGLENYRPKPQLLNGTNVLVTAGGVGANGSIQQLSPNQWMHVAYVWSPLNRSLNIYLDGVLLIAQMTYANPAFNGGQAWFMRGLTNGYVDEFRVWNYDRTWDELSYWHNRYFPAISGYVQAPIYGIPLLAYYRFDDDASNIVDFAHLPRKSDFFAGTNYFLPNTAGMTATNPAMSLLGTDDEDDDELPEWWAEIHNLDQYPSFAYGPEFLYYQEDSNNVGRVSFFKTFRAYGSIGNQSGWAQAVDDIVYQPKDRSLGNDGQFAVFMKYIYLQKTPEAATLNLFTPGMQYTAAYVNGQRVPAPGGDTNQQQVLDITTYLRAGRNMIYVRCSSLLDLWYDYARTIPALPNADDPHFERVIGKFDASLTVDGVPHIVRGDTSRLDPRAVWFGMTWSMLWHMTHAQLGDPVLPDRENRFLPGNPDYGVPFNADADNLNALYEFFCGTNPRKEESNNEGVFDSQEDFDRDGLLNGEEQARMSDPRLPDTDDDGLGDAPDAVGDNDPASSLSPGVSRAVILGGTTNDYVEFPMAKRFALDAWTLEAWLRPATNETDGGVIIERAVGPNGVNYELGLATNNTPYVRFVANDGAVVMATNGLALGTNWAHLAGVYDANRRELRLYTGGVLAASAVVEKSPAIYAGGPVHQRIGRGFAGALDDLRIWGTARTAAEIADHFEGALVGNEAGLAAYYRCDDGTSFRSGAPLVGTSANNGTNGLLRVKPWSWGQVEDYTRLYTRDWWEKWTHAASFVGASAFSADGDGALIIPPSLRVTLYPSGAVTSGAQWAIQGYGSWRDSGVAVYEGLAPTNYTILFRSVYGWTSPSNRTVGLTNGMMTSISETYIRNGGVVVNLQFNDNNSHSALWPISNAQWRVSNGPWRNSGEVVDNLTPGEYLIEFRSIPGWSEPAPLTIQILSGGTGIYIGQYEPASGSLQIFINPETVRTNGAMWRTGASGWTNSGAIVTGLPLGTNTVYFNNVPPALTPTNLSFYLTNATVVQGVGTYTEVGYLQVILLPTGAIPAGAQWRVDGGVWQNSGMTNALAVGIHQVDYRSIFGWRAPNTDSNVLVQRLERLVITNYYVEGERSISGTIYTESDWENLAPFCAPPGDCSGTGTIVVGVWYYEADAIGSPIARWMDYVATGPLPFSPTNTYNYVINRLDPRGDDIVPGYKLQAWIDANANGRYEIGEPRSQIQSFWMGDENRESVNLTIKDDQDVDGLPDFWEVHWFGNLAQTATIDYDRDGLNNGQEYFLSQSSNVLATINPADYDSDDDGMDDFWEYERFLNNHGLNPCNWDATGDLDGDALSNLREYLGMDDTPRLFQDPTAAPGVATTNILSYDWMNPLNYDTDNDGLVDSFECAWYAPLSGISPLGTNNNMAADPDVDGLTSYREQCLLMQFRQGGSNDIWTLGTNALPRVATNGIRGLSPKLALGATNLTLEADLAALRQHAWTDPANPDTDGDILPDGWELEFNLDPKSVIGNDGKFGDPDADGLLNYEEYYGQDGYRFTTRPYVNGTGDETNPKEHNWRPDSTYTWRWYSTNAADPTITDPRVGKGTQRAETLGSAQPTISLGTDWGLDSDDDGLNDNIEIHPPAGTPASSPVYSCDPFIPRAALITAAAGILIPDPEPATNGVREDLQRRDWTIECMVKLLGTNLNGFLFNFQTYAGGARTVYSLALVGNRPVLASHNSDGAVYTLTANALPTNQWIHLAGVWSHANNDLELYLDGILFQGQAVYGECASSLMLPATNALALAVSPDGSFVNQLYLDEVRIWGLARTPALINAYARQLAPAANGDDVWIDNYCAQYYGQNDTLLVNGGTLFEGEPGIPLSNVYRAGASYWIDNGDAQYNQANDVVLVGGTNLVEGLNGTAVASVLYNDKDQSGGFTRNSLLAYYRFDDGGTSAEDFARRAKSGLLGATDENYLFGDRGYALPTNAFNWVTNGAAPVLGCDQFGADDSDGDGMPDAWEVVNRLNPYDDGAGEETAPGLKNGPNGPLGDPDGDGLLNLYEYHAGTNPRAQNSDGDETPDTQEDRDGDLVVNIIEQSLGSRPDIVDTDDDGLTDSEEQSRGSAPDDPTDPPTSRAVRFGGDATDYLEVPVSFKQRLTSWTLEAWVNPDSVAGGAGTIIRRVVQEVGGTNALNFLLGIEPDGSGGLRAYAGYVLTDGRAFLQSGGAIATGVWTHVAASYNGDAAMLIIYTNGWIAATNNTFNEAPPINGLGGQTFVRIGEDFGGLVDELRIWNSARLGHDISNGMYKAFATTDTNLAHNFRFDDGQANTNAIPFGLYHQPHGAQDFTYTADWNQQWRHAAAAHGNVTFFEPGAIVPPPSLRVTLYPTAAIQAGAQWSVDGGAWQNSGTIRYDLEAGAHTILYKSLSGWTAPTNETVILSNAVATALSRVYLANGRLRVTIEPEEVRLAGAQWRVDLGAWTNSGATITNLSPGAHLVDFLPVAGWSEPPAESIFIPEGQLVDIPRSYSPTYGYLCVTIEPSNAVAAGAQWRVMGGGWQASGVTNLLRTGVYTVDFAPVANWITPEALTNAVVQSGVVTRITAVYREGIQSASGSIENRSVWQNVSPWALPPGDGSATGQVMVGVWSMYSEVKGLPQYRTFLNATNPLPFGYGATFSYVIGPLAYLRAPMPNHPDEVYLLKAWIDGNANGEFEEGEPSSETVSFQFYEAMGSAPNINVTVVDDLDGAGLPDWWEIHWFGNTAQAAAGDYDRDGLSNLQEYNLAMSTNLLAALNPAHYDSDADGMDDLWEYERFIGGLGLNPTTNDAAGDLDGEGLSNIREYNGMDQLPRITQDPKAAVGIATTNIISTDALNAMDVDTDNDGLIDSFEAAWYDPAGGINPRGTNDNKAADSDHDGLPHYREQCLLPQLAQGGSNDVWSLGTNAFPVMNLNGLRAFSPKLLLGATNALFVDDIAALRNHAWTCPTAHDTDGDLLPDGWEVEFNLDPRSAIGANGFGGDPDGDTLLNWQEYLGQDGNRLTNSPYISGTGDETNPKEHNVRPDSTGPGPGIARPVVATNYWVQHADSPTNGTLGSARPTASLGVDSGVDTDDDGLPDNVEIQMEYAALGVDPSPVHSMSPFIKRAARITATNGIPIPDPEGTAARGYSPLLHARDWTVECYVKLLDPDMSGALIRNVGPTAGGPISYELALTGNVAVIQFQTVAGYLYKVVGPELPTNRWIHLAGVWNDMDNSLALYVDGVFVQEQRVTEEAQTIQLYPSAEPVRIGVSDAATFVNKLFMDEIRIWGAARTADEIERYRTRLAPQNATNLLAYYRFDDGGTTAEDFTRKAQNGLLGAVSVNYTYGDRGWALSNGFAFVTNDFAPVLGVDYRGADDADGDGMPDDWEMVNHLDPNSADGVNGAWGDLDGDGLVNIYEFWADTNPRAWDTDQNGVYDTQEDRDGDTVVNVTEQALGSRPDIVDTDDDSLADNEEQSAGTNPADPMDPPVSRALEFGGAPSDYLEVPIAFSQRLMNWTIEAWVNPTNVADGAGVILERVVQNLGGGTNAINYMLGLEADGLGGLRAYAGYVLADGQRFVLSGGTIAAGTWTHIAATYNNSAATLVLSPTGQVAAATSAFNLAPPMNGKGGETFVRIGPDFGGRIDEVRLWNVARTALEVTNNLNRGLSMGTTNLVHSFRFDDSEANTNAFPFGIYHQPQGAQDFMFVNDWNEQWRHAARKAGAVRFVEPGAILPPPNLRVILLPEEAALAGARWSVDGGQTWNNSGATLHNLVAGTNEVLYSIVAGWTAPATERIVLTNGTVTTLNRTYLRNGSLQIFLEPPLARDQGAQWRVDGGGWTNSGVVVTNLAPGPHTVDFKTIDGWEAPSSTNLVLSEAYALIRTYYYEASEGFLVVTILPTNAIAAGAQWRLDGGVWQASGVTNIVRSGTHTVEFLAIPGWTAPAAFTNVAILRGATNSVTGIYQQGVQSISGYVFNEALWDNLGVHSLPPGDGTGTGTVIVGIWNYGSSLIGAPILGYSASLLTTNLPFAAPDGLPYTIEHVAVKGTIEIPGYTLMAWIDGNANGAYELGEPRSGGQDFSMLSEAGLSAVNVTIGDDANTNNLPDWWEAHWFRNLDQRAADDYDRDGLSNGEEYQLSISTNLLAALNPAHFDSDGDGMDDWWEYAHFARGRGLIPTTNDATGDVDGEGLSNYREYLGLDDLPRIAQNPLKAAGIAVTNILSSDALNPRDIDTDNDGLVDSFEFAWYAPAAGIRPLGTNDNLAADSDQDGMTHYREQCLLLQFREGATNDIWSDGTNGWPGVDADGIRAFVPKVALGATNLLLTNDILALRGHAWTDPADWDTDDDLLPDGWEVEFALDPRDATGDDGFWGDPDGDTLINQQEFLGQDGNRNTNNPYVSGTGDETNPNEHNVRPDSTGVGPGIARPTLPANYWYDYGAWPTNGTLGAALPTLSMGTDFGLDTDDDGLADQVEIQMEYLALGVDPSPVHSMSPFIKRAARVTDVNGILIPDPEGSLTRGYSPLLHKRDWTVECYVKLTGTNLNGALVYNPGPLGLGDISYALVLSNNQVFVMFNTLGGFLYKTAGPVLPPNRWIHLAGVWDHGNNSLGLYVDGIFVQEQRVYEDALSSRFYLSGGQPRLGWDPSGSLVNRLYLDEVRIWGAARTADEIERYRTRLAPQNATNLLAYYRFDDGGTTAEDFTRKAQNGLLGAVSVNYTYGDRGWALSNGFAFVTNDFAPVLGVDYRGADDADGDGMPDDWEMVNHLDPDSTNGVNGAWGDLDGDGLVNIYEFWADTNPRAWDTDQNGVFDTQEDRDGDFVVNVTEQALGSRPDMVDTDDDGLTDDEERAAGTNPADPADPPVSRALHFAGGTNDYLDIPINLGQRLMNWTVEAWVNPTNVAEGAGVILERVVQNLGGGTNAINYVLGLEADGLGGLRAYAGYVLADGQAFILRGGAIATGAWTHLAASYDNTNSTLAIYTNGQVAVMTNGFNRAPPMNGKGGETYVRIGADFGGRLDELRLWGVARSEADVSNNINRALSAGTSNLVHSFRFDDSQANTNVLPFGPFHQPWGAQDFMYARDWNDQWRHAAMLRGAVEFVEPGAILPPPSLRIILQPAEAVAEGARWSLDGGQTWNNSGDTLHNLFAGTNAVIYTDITGWTEPGNETIVLTNGTATTLIRTYLRNGSLQIILEPALARDEGAQWRVDGGGWTNSATVVTNLAPGPHLVDFKTIEGWDTPPSTNITLPAGSALVQTYYYVLTEGFLVVHLDPTNAVAAGAQWQLNGGSWQNSDVTNRLRTGSYTINFRNIAGWTTPAAQSNVLVTREGTNLVIGTYLQGVRPISGYVFNQSLWDNLGLHSLPPGDGTGTGTVIVGVWHYGSAVIGPPISDYRTNLLTTALPFSVPGGLPYMIQNIALAGTEQNPAYKLMAWIDGDANGGYDPGEPRSQIQPFAMLNDAGLSAQNVTIGDDMNTNSLPDWWEIHWFGNLDQTADGDYDRDGFSNLAEYNLSRLTNALAALNPAHFDSDGDGMDDKWEWDRWAGGAGLNPATNDALGDVDGDGLSNYREYMGMDDLPQMMQDHTAATGIARTNAASADAMNPLDIDSDGDWLVDSFEAAWYLPAAFIDPLGTNGILGLDPDKDGLPHYREQCLLMQFRQGASNDIWSLGTNGWPVTAANGIREFAPKLALGATNATLDADLAALRAHEWTHPVNPDTDADLLPDGWEVEYALDPRDATGDNGFWGDPDNDLLYNTQEYLGQDGDRSTNTEFISGTGDETNPNEHNWRPDSTGVGPGLARPVVPANWWNACGGWPNYGTLGAALPTFSLGADGGADTDDDGVSDSTELWQEYLSLGFDPSPVHSMSPFFKKSARVTSMNGIPLPDPEGGLTRGWLPLLHGRAWTLECYVKLLRNNLNGSLILIPGPLGLGDISAEIALSTNEVGVSFHTVGGFYYRTAGPVLPTNRWIHLAGVWDPLNNALSLYVDGVFVQTKRVYEEALSSRCYTSAEQPVIGYSGDGSMANNLLVDEVRIWTVARTADQIEQYRRKLVPQNAWGLAAYYRFDDGGATAEDFARKAQNGLLGAETNNYTYGDFGYALSNGFVFVTNDYANVLGVDARGADDTDGDGLPDDWEVMNHLNPFSTNYPYGANDDPDGDSLVNIYEYWADTNPRAWDTAQPQHLDTQGDRDGDGLLNLMEQVLGTRPDIVDTDDDGLNDGEEYARGSNPAEANDPPVARGIVLGGAATDYVEIPIALVQRLPEWTIEAWVNPDSVAGGAGALLRRVVQALPGGYAMNFTLGLEPDGLGGLRAYAGFVTDTGQSNIIRGGSVPAGAWSQLAASFDSRTAALNLYFNGGLIAATNTFAAAPPINGQGGNTFVRAGEDIAGQIDEVRIWSVVRTPLEITSYYNRVVNSAQSNLVNYFRFDDNQASSTNMAFNTYHQPHGAQDYHYPSDWSNQWIHAATLVGNTQFREPGALLVPPILRVFLEPPAAVEKGARWRANNGDWQLSGASLDDLLGGTNFLFYKELSGWTAPSNEVIVLTNGVTTTLYREYLLNGDLTVGLSPNDAIAAGAQWSVAGRGWTNSGATVTNLTPGYQLVVFKPIDGWIEPDPTNLLVVSGVNSIYNVAPYIRADDTVAGYMVPPDVLALGARWSLDGGGSYTNGQVVPVTVGAHVMSFSDVSEEWITPTNIPFISTGGGRISITGVYVHVTGLRMFIEPPEARAMGAQWRIAAGATNWLNSGRLLALTPGFWTVEFKPIANWTKPNNVSAQVTYTNITRLTNTYYNYIVLTGGMVAFSFNAPRDIWIDAARRLWVADGLNHRIFVISNDIYAVTNYGENGTGLGQLNNPRGVTLDAAGNLWVADTGNHRIQRRLAATGVWTAFGGPSAGSGLGQFSSPMDLEFDAGGYLYVADSGNNRVQRMSPGGVWSVWLAAGTGNGQVTDPRGVFFDPLGNLFVADVPATDQGRVQKISAAGAYMETVGSYTAPLGELKRPRNMALRVGGTNGFVTANTGNSRLALKDFNTGVWSNMFPAGALSEPEGVAVNASNEMYIADTGNNRILKVTPVTIPPIGPVALAFAGGSPTNGMVVGWPGVATWTYWVTRATNIYGRGGWQMLNGYIPGVDGLQRYTNMPLGAGSPVYYRVEGTY